MSAATEADIRLLCRGVCAHSLQIGLSHLRDEAQVDRLPRMLALPFVKGAGETSASGSDRR